MPPRDCPAARGVEGGAQPGKASDSQGSRRGSGKPARGYSSIELLTVLFLVGVLSVAAVPLVLAGLESNRVKGAARYLAARLQQARSEAAKRNAHVGLRITAAAGYEYALYVDGNGDGLRTLDIASGTDTRLSPPERLDDHFPGVTFGILDDVIAVDSSDLLAAGSDPIRLGSSDILSFGPAGTATAGTLYLRGRGGEQFAVRVLGTTGRVRTLRFDFPSRQWVLP